MISSLEQHRHRLELLGVGAVRHLAQIHHGLNLYAILDELYKKELGPMASNMQYTA